MYFFFKEYYKDLFSRLKPGSVFVELGAFKGESIKFACGLGKGVRCYTVDRFEITDDSEGYLAKEDYYPEFYENTKDLNIIPIKSVTWDAASLFDDNSVDAIFFDASHDDGLEKEIIAWLPKIKKNGIIAGDDYEHFAFPKIKEIVDSYFTVKTFPSDNGIHKIWEAI
jgi:hypothetical protein